MHPAIRSTGSLIVPAARQLMTLARPAALTSLDITMQVGLNVSRHHHELSLTTWEY